MIQITITETEPNPDYKADFGYDNPRELTKEILTTRITLEQFRAVQNAIVDGLYPEERKECDYHISSCNET